MTVFLRTTIQLNLTGGSIYLGALFFSLLCIMFNGFAETSLTIARLPVFFKQRDLLFYPAWAYTLPTFILRIPQSVVESFLWVSLTYYVIGFAPQPTRQIAHFPIPLFALSSQLIVCIRSFECFLSGFSGNIQYCFLHIRCLHPYSDSLVVCARP